MIRAMTRVQARRARQAHAGRALCAGLAAVSIVLALGILGGTSLDDPELIALAAFVGGLALAGWIHSVRTDERSIVRRIDDRLHLGGGFVAAFENAALERMRPVAELDAYHMLKRAPRWRMRDAAVPHVVGFVALPFAALALLVGAIRVLDREAAHERGLQQNVRAMAGKARGTLASAEGLESNELASLLESLDAARDASGGDDTREAMRDVAESADTLAARDDVSPEIREMLEALAFEAEAAAAGDPLDPDEDLGAGERPVEERGAASGTNPEEESGAGGDASHAGEHGEESGPDDPGAIAVAGETVPSGGSGGTGSAPDSGDDEVATETGLPDPSGEPPSQDQGPPRSARVTRWWPKSEAAIVEGWLAIVQRAR